MWCSQNQLIYSTIGFTLVVVFTLYWHEFWDHSGIFTSHIKPSTSYTTSLAAIKNNNIHPELRFIEPNVTNKKISSSGFNLYKQNTVVPGHSEAKEKTKGS